MPKFSEQYDSGNYPDIRDSINNSKGNKLNIKNVSDKINSNDQIVWTTNNVFKKYKDILSQYTIEIELKDNEKFKPHFLSKRYYGVQDLWYLILLMNDMHSIMEFNKKKVKVFNRKYIEIINKILIENEDKIGKIRKLSDLTYKKIK
jgi:hypothetical protein